MYFGGIGMEWCPKNKTKHCLHRNHTKRGVWLPIGLLVDVTARMRPETTGQCSAVLAGHLINEATQGENTLAAINCSLLIKRACVRMSKIPANIFWKAENIFGRCLSTHMSTLAMVRLIQSLVSPSRRVVSTCWLWLARVRPPRVQRADRKFPDTWHESCTRLPGVTDFSGSPTTTFGGHDRSFMSANRNIIISLGQTLVYSRNFNFQMLFWLTEIIVVECILTTSVQNTLCKYYVFHCIINCNWV